MVLLNELIVEMKYIMKLMSIDLLQIRNLSVCRTFFYLSFALLFSACATAVIVEQTPRENDDRTELQKQLDREITQKVTKRIQSSRELKSSQLHISTYKHVVTLNGFVKTKKHKSTALRLTISVSGVKTVISDIGIQNN